MGVVTVVGVVGLGAVLRVVGVVVVVVVVGVVRLVDVVVGFVVVGLVVVLGFVGPPNDPPPAVEPVPSCWARAEATEMQRIAVVEINRNDRGQWLSITFLLLDKTSRWVN